MKKLSVVLETNVSIDDLSYGRNEARKYSFQKIFYHNQDIDSVVSGRLNKFSYCTMAHLILSVFDSREWYQ